MMNWRIIQGLEVVVKIYGFELTLSYFWIDFTFQLDGIYLRSFSFSLDDDTVKNDKIFLSNLLVRIENL